jgi:hypothetical protein
MRATRRRGPELPVSRRDPRRVGGALPGGARSLATLLLGAVLAAGFVLPPDKIVHVIASRRAGAPPLRVELEVTRAGERDPFEVRAELHPARGVRLRDADGRRWLVREGRVSGSGDGDGDGRKWIPELDLLVLQDEEGLLAWLEARGVDATVSQLARCGEADCFVVGGRDRPSQLWVDKESFEVRKLRSRSGRMLELEAYVDWEGVRFPGRAWVSDPLGPVAELAVRSVAPAPELEDADFSPAWLVAGER